MTLSQFFLIILSFIFFTIIGTQSHELGHVLVAKILGCETRLSYGSMTYSNDKIEKEYFKFYELYGNEIREECEFPGQSRFYELSKEWANIRFWIIIGGPLQTMLTGIVGFYLLIKFRKNRHNLDFNFKEWVVTFLALFWLREPFNMLGATVGWMLNGETVFVGDEFQIANYLGFHPWSVSIILGLIGLSIAFFIIFKIMPKRYWIGFNLAGIMGGLLGFYLWFDILGPFLFQ